MNKREKVIIGIGCLVVFVCLFAIIGVALYAMTLLGLNNITKTAISSDTGSLSYPSSADQSTAKTCLNMYIKSVAPTSPLNDKAENFIASGKAGNVNPALLVAIGQQESALGTAGITGITNYNYYGYESGKKNFGSWENAISYQGPYMQRVYLSQGLNTIPQIATKYAPVGASNDPSNLNSNWVKGVSGAFDRITSQCSNFQNATELAGGTSVCGNNIIAQAAKYNGIPYSQNRRDCGSKNDKGPEGVKFLDCSSYVSRVYNDLGLLKSQSCFSTIEIPGLSDLVEISSQNVQPGDIVRSGYYIGTNVVKYANGEPQGHTFIYVKGDITKKFYIWEEGGNKQYVHYDLRGASPENRYFRAKACIKK